MIYLELFLGFLKVGCFSFGGAYAAIPLIRDIVFSYGWLNDEMLSCMIAVSESTPGPIMVNLATYVGSSQASLPGAAIATFAVVLPSFLIILLITAILNKVIRNPYVQAALRGLKPAMAGILLTTGCFMIFSNLFKEPYRTLNPTSCLLTLLLLSVYFLYPRIARKPLSPIVLIIAAAILGAFGYGL